MLVAALFGLVAISAQATPITFTFTSTNMNGTLGATNFNNETLTVTVTADTSNLVNCGSYIGYEGGGGACFGSSLTGDFTVGSSSGTFTSLLYVFNNTVNNVLGFGIETDNLDVTVPGGSTYDMVSAFGPAAASGVSMFFSSEGTSLGALTASGDGSTTTFQAAFDQLSVPEPGELALFGLGLLGLMGLAIRRRA